MNIHLLIPFYRKHLAKTLLHYYGQMGIIVHPICDEIDIEPFVDNTLEWVKPFLCPALKPGEQCYTKFNYFIEAGDLIEDDYYGFCGDDDMFEPRFFDDLKTHTADVVYNSNYRGDSIPNDGTCGHGTSPLIIAEAGNVRIDYIGLGMFFVKGCILKDLRFNQQCGGGDGEFAIALLKAPTIEYRSWWFVFGNYFQPGRHTNPAKFLKPTWELPQIII